MLWPGVIVEMDLAPANVHDLRLAEELLQEAQEEGWVLGERNYWSPELEERLGEEGLCLLAPYKSKKREGKRSPRWLVQKRRRIETVIAPKIVHMGDVPAVASLVGCPSYMYRGGISLAADFILYPEKGEHVMGARRLGVVLLGAVMAVTLLVVLVVGAVPEKADAAPRFRVLIIKKTFTSDQQITIPSGGAAASYPSEKNASGFRKGKIRDVNLTLEKFSHRIPDDVDVMLSHRGVNRTVMSDIGGALLVNNMTLRLDDEAAALLPDNGPLLGGAFRPLNASTGGIDSFPSSAPTPSGLANLSGFDGKNPKGPWKLWVVDDTPNLDGGEFDGGWSITIKVKAKVRRSR